MERDKRGEAAPVVWACGGDGDGTECSVALSLVFWETGAGRGRVGGWAGWLLDAGGE